jgi:hypothetical protein
MQQDRCSPYGLEEKLQTSTRTGIVFSKKLPLSAQDAREEGCYQPLKDQLAFPIHTAKCTV